MIIVFSFNQFFVREQNFSRDELSTVLHGLVKEGHLLGICTNRLPSKKPNIRAQLNTLLGEDDSVVFFPDDRIICNTAENPMANGWVPNNDKFSRLLDLQAACDCVPLVYITRNLSKAEQKFHQKLNDQGCVYMLVVSQDEALTTSIGNGLAQIQGVELNKNARRGGHYVNLLLREQVLQDQQLMREIKLRLAAEAALREISAERAALEAALREISTERVALLARIAELEAQVLALVRQFEESQRAVPPQQNLPAEPSQLELAAIQRTVSGILQNYFNGINPGCFYSLFGWVNDEQITVREIQALVNHAGTVDIIRGMLEAEITRINDGDNPREPLLRPYRDVLTSCLAALDQPAAVQSRQPGISPV